MERRVFPGICHGLGDQGGFSCSVALRGGALAIERDGREVASLRYAAATVSLTGVDDKYLCFSGKADGRQIQILVPGREIVVAMEAIGVPEPLLAALRSKTRARTVRTTGRVGFLLALVVLAAGLVLGGVLAARFAMGKAVELIPVEWESTLGRAAAMSILAEEKTCADPELVAAMAEIGSRLVGGLGTTRYAFRLRVLDTPDVNAFALPGGYLFVNRGLIEKAEDGAEVAGVLAHEISHVEKRHGVRNVTRQAGLMVALSAVVGDIGALEQVLLENAAGLAAMAYSRDQEREADAAGLALMRRAGIDATGLVRFLSKLAKEEGSLGSLLTIVSTHPASAERVAEMKSLLAAAPIEKPVPFMRNLAGFRGRCTPLSVSDPDQP